MKKNYLLWVSDIHANVPVGEYTKYGWPPFDSRDVYEKRNVIYVIEAEDAIELKLLYPKLQIMPNFDENHV